MLYRGYPANRGRLAAEESLCVEGLSVTYCSGDGEVSALRNISLCVHAGQTLGIVGESGSGKSSLGFALMRLLPKSARISGRVVLGGENLLTYSEKEMGRIRGKRIGMVFQDALASLNPVFTVQSQLVDVLRCHWPEMTRRDAIERVAAMMDEMGISRDRLNNYPHQFSGGMRQRVMIAAALAADPDFLIADESTSDLDTVTQKAFLELLARVQKARRLGLIVISHDLGVIRALCETVAVLYRGDLVEYGRASEILRKPRHWYSQGLLAVSMRKRDENGFLRTLPSRAVSDTGSLQSRVDEVRRDSRS